MLPAGALLDRYEILAPLGEGGMGSVFVARDLILGRDVAIKVLHDVEPGSAERLLREAKAAAAVRHPNIVVVYDFGIENGTTYLVMEHIDGVTLRDHVPSSAALGRKVRWLLDLARALAAIHAVGLVHRDIKPHNILIDADGRARLIDLGLAAPRGTSNQRVGAGTPGYSAPEQVAGHVDARSDQYAWGITAFELLVGTRPTGDARLGADVPEPLAAAILRAFAPDPDRRHPSMAALAALLEPFAERATINRAPRPLEAAPPGQPRRLAPGYTLDAAVIVLAFAVWLVASGARPQATAASQALGPSRALPTRVDFTTADAGALDERELTALQAAAPAIKTCLDTHPTAPAQLTVHLLFDSDAAATKVLGWSDPDISRTFVACAQSVLDPIDLRPRPRARRSTVQYRLIAP